MEVEEASVHSLRECQVLAGHCGEPKKAADETQADRVSDDGWMNQHPKKSCESFQRGPKSKRGYERRNHHEVRVRGYQGFGCGGEGGRPVLELRAVRGSHR